MEEALERIGGQAVLLVGASGIGKTALIEALMQRLKKHREGKLTDVFIVGVDTAKLLASSADEREQSQRISSLIGKLGQMEEPSLLVIDDVQMLLEGSQGGKSSMLLKYPSKCFKQGECQSSFKYELRCFPSVYGEASPSHRAEVLQLEELSQEWLVNILKAQGDALSQQYKLSLSPEAYRHALHLTSRFFKERVSPLLH